MIATNDQTKCSASLCSLKSQYARGVHYFVGEALIALDVYWTAFANLLDPLPQEHCPMAGALRQAFVVAEAVVRSNLIHCFWNTVHAFFASISVIQWSYSRPLERL